MFLKKHTFSRITSFKMMVSGRKLSYLSFLFWSQTQHLLIIVSKAILSSMVQDGGLPKAHLTMSVCMLVVPPLQAVVKSEVFSGKGASLLSFMESIYCLLTLSGPLCMYCGWNLEFLLSFAALSRCSFLISLNSGCTVSRFNDTHFKRLTNEKLNQPYK